MEYKALVSGNYIMTDQIRNALVMGENLPCTFAFYIKGTQLPSFCYLLYQRPGDKAPFIVPVLKTVTEWYTKLTYAPTLHFCEKAGEVAIQLIACEISDPEEVGEDDENVVKLTEVAIVNVSGSLVDPDNPQPLESIFTEYLTKYETLLAETKQQANRAGRYAQEAGQAKDDAIAALSGLTQRVGALETPVEISDSEIDDIFE